MTSAQTPARSLSTCAARTARRLTAPGALLCATAAHACTVCDSATGHQVRAGIFDGHFLGTLWRVALPFPIFAAAALLIYFAMPDLQPADATQELR